MLGGQVIDQTTLALIKDQLLDCIHLIDAHLVSPVQPEPEKRDSVCWLNPAGINKPVISLVRPRLAAVSILGRKKAWHVALNCHAVQDYLLATTDKLSFGVDQNEKLLLIRVDPQGVFPVSLHMGRGKLNGYQVSSQLLIKNLEDLGVPLNTKIPVQFDNNTKTWIGKLSDAQPVPEREHKPKTGQQTLV